MTAIVFTDPNCPFCYATEERLHDLGLAGCVDWRGVQHAPELPEPMRPAEGALARELPQEVDAVRRLAPDVPIAVPPGKPRTRPAIEHAAAALRADAERGRAFVRALYRAFWVDGADLSDAGVLARLAAEAGLPALDPDPATADLWQAQWRSTGLAGVPAILLEDGRVLYGLQDPEVLREAFAR